MRQRLGGVTEIKPFVIFTGKHCSYNLKVIDCKDQYLRIIQQDVIFGRLQELILDGKNVKLDDLAIFSVGIVSKKGAQSAADFSLANNVKGLKLRARATGELSNAQINLDGQLKESSLYTVGGKAPDGSGSDGGSGGSDGNQGENPLG